MKVVAARMLFDKEEIKKEEQKLWRVCRIIKKLMKALVRFRMI